MNDLGEYMTAASDNLREAAGNAVTAYTFSTLENRNDFSEQDFQLMFTMDGPKRKGDVNRYHKLFKKMEARK